MTDSLEVTRLLPATVARLGATLWHLWTRRGSGQGTVKPFTAPRTSFSATLTPRRSIAFTDVSLADVKTVKEAFGVKFNDVATAVVGGGLRRYLVDHGGWPNRPLVAAEQVSVHGRVGNVKGVTKLSVIFSTLATDVEDPVERLRAVASANVRAKEISAAMGSDTFARWAGQAWPNALSLAAPVLGLARCRAPPGDLQRALLERGGSTFDLYLAGARVAGTYAFGPITDGAGLNVTVISTGTKSARYRSVPGSHTGGVGPREGHSRRARRADGGSEAIAVDRRQRQREQPDLILVVSEHPITPVTRDPVQSIDPRGYRRSDATAPGPEFSCGPSPTSLSVACSTCSYCPFAPNSPRKSNSSRCAIRWRCSDAGRTCAYEPADRALLAALSRLLSRSYCAKLWLELKKWAQSLNVVMFVSVSRSSALLAASQER